MEKIRFRGFPLICGFWSGSTLFASMSMPAVLSLRNFYHDEIFIFTHVNQTTAGPRSAIGRAPDSLVRGLGFDTWSGHILSFHLPLFQEGHLSVTGESMCTKYWLTA